MVSGCVSKSDGAAVVHPSQGAAIAPDVLVGSWGVASYHTDKDRARTEREARAQCRLPYVIRRGPTDGLLIHAADDPKIHELKLKRSSDGKVFLGFDAPPGDIQDREILSRTDKLVVMRYVDPDAHRRYGTMLYARC